MQYSLTVGLIFPISTFIFHWFVVVVVVLAETAQLYHHCLFVIVGLFLYLICQFCLLGRKWFYSIPEVPLLSRFLWYYISFPLSPSLFLSPSHLIHDRMGIDEMLCCKCVYARLMERVKERFQNSAPTLHLFNIWK